MPTRPSRPGTAAARRASRRQSTTARAEVTDRLFGKSTNLEGQLLRTLLEKLRDPTVVLRPDGLIAHLNGAAAHMFRRSPMDVIGRNSTLLFPNENGSIGQITRAGSIHRTIKSLTGVTAKRRSLRLQAAVSTIEIDGAPHLLLSLEDVSRTARMRDRLRAARTLFAKIVELSDDAIVSIDGSGRITLFSPGAERVFGFSAHEVLGRPLEMLMPKAARATHRRSVDGFLKAGNPVRRMGERGEIVAIRKSGAEFPAEASIMRFELGGQTVLTAILRDITERKSRELALKESERLFRAIFDQTFQYIGLLQPDGIVIEVNRTALEFGGLNRTDVIGRPFLDTRWWALPMEARNRLRSALQRAAAGEFVRYETEIRGAGDLIRIVDFSIKPVFDDAGGVALLIAEGRDISERVEADAALRLSEARLANAQRIAKLGNWDWKLSSNELYWSEEVYRIFGVHRGTFGATYHAFLNSVHPDDREAVMGAVGEALQNGRKYSIDHRVLRPDGTEATVHEEGEVVRDATGHPIQMTGTVQDITERKQEEAAIGLAKQHAELANRAKSEFLANMSHELRTPLNAIIGFSEIMMRETLGPLNGRYGRYAQDIWNAGKHLLSVISDVLDVSKIEAGSLKLNESEIDVVGVISACMQMVSERAATGRLYLRSEVEPGLPNLVGDERLLKQMLLNLLSNAIKFTVDGGVTLTARAGHGGTMVIAVSDTGIGIAQADIPKALEPFGQIDTALNRKFGGTGLGLHLTRSMVELHGGTLHLQSEPGVGTVASLHFPKARTLDKATAPADAAPAHSPTA